MQLHGAKEDRALSQTVKFSLALRTQLKQALINQTYLGGKDSYASLESKLLGSTGTPQEHRTSSQPEESNTTLLCSGGGRQTRIVVSPAPAASPRVCLGKLTS